MLELHLCPNTSEPDIWFCVREIIYFRYGHFKEDAYMLERSRVAS